MTPRRFYSLDVLRGVAALAVVFWHWQHFFYNGTQRSTVLAEDLPLYTVFSPLYAKGWLGVDLFFCLSGFIFYWLYSARVAGRAISARDFFVLRFSRLYPLHFATLIAVAVGQALYLRATGSYFIYPYNDAYHFGLNLVFAPAWGLEQGTSFNAPVWSVSVEVAMYALFFALCRFLPVRGAVLLGAAAVGFLIVEGLYLPLGRGMGGFFIGGYVYLVYARIVAEERIQSVLRWLPWLVGGLWLLGLIAVIVPGNAWLETRTAHLYPSSLIFPLTILLLALLETRRGHLLRRVAFLGDMSYASYLLHFPLQMLVFAAVLGLGLDRSLFYSPWTLAAFIALLLLFSFASHRWFEVPAQRALRKRGLTYAFL